MGRLVVKETVTKEREIEISVEALLALINSLTLEEKKKLFSKLSVLLKKKKPLELHTFKKDKIEAILADFANTNLYEDDFLLDLKEGLRKSTLYK